MFCENCGKPMNDGANFCRECGCRATVRPSADSPMSFTPIEPKQTAQEVASPTTLLKKAQEEAAPTTLLKKTPEAQAPAAPVSHAPVMRAPVAPANQAPTMRAPVAPAMQAPAAPVNQVPAAPAQQKPLAYQEPSAPAYPPYYPAPAANTSAEKPKKKHTALIVILVVAVVAIVGLLLWQFVFSNDESQLAGTKWIGENGRSIAFTDEKNGYVDFNGMKVPFQYTLSDGKLVLREDEFSNEAMGCKIQGDEMELTSPETGERLYFYNEKSTFQCECCYETTTGWRHTAMVKGYSYIFCEDCWEESKDLIE